MKIEKNPKIFEKTYYYSIGGVFIWLKIQDYKP